MSSCQIFDNEKCDLGEGPLWHPRANAFLWFDILNSKLNMSDGLTRKSWNFDQYVSAAAWVDDDTILVIGERDLMAFSFLTGQSTPFAQIEADNPDTRSNDSRADRQNGFWIGTMGKTAQEGAGAIYRYYRGEVRKLHDKITISNAICFAPDGKTAYFTDTVVKTAFSQKLNPDTGWPVEEAKAFLNFGPERGGCDGAIIDADGNIWIAFWGEGCVEGFDQDGQSVGKFICPTPQTTCPAIGGPNLDQLLVTSAKQGLDDKHLDADNPAGKTFLFENAFKGIQEPNVIIGG